jgi:pantetheine-phosphate adenylyltransferase
VSENRIALCPGSYDPVTYGHVDIIQRASILFDEVVVGVVIGSTRKKYMFETDRRIEFARDALAHLDNVRVEGFNMLVTEFARQTGACALVKGLRAISDFDYEFQMAQINKGLAPEIETVYLPASAKYSFLSSSGVREIAVWGGAVDDWVPANVVAAFRQMAGTHHEEE